MACNAAEEVEEEIEYKMTITPDHLVFGYEENTKQLWVDTDVEHWEAMFLDPKDDWVRVVGETTGGNAGAVINISVDKNTGSSTRKAFITIASTVMTRTALIEQRPEKEEEEFIDISLEGNLEFMASGELTKTFTIKSNREWTITGHDKDRWLSVTPTIGNEDIVTVTVTVEENKLEDSRYVILSIKGEREEVKVKVVQNGKEPETPDEPEV